MVVGVEWLVGGVEGVDEVWVGGCEFVVDCLGWGKGGFVVWRGEFLGEEIEGVGYGVGVEGFVGGVDVVVESGFSGLIFVLYDVDEYWVVLVLVVVLGGDVRWEVEVDGG